MKPEPRMYTMSNYDSNQVRCNFLQKKIFFNGKYMCERCSLYTKSDGLYGCTMDTCSENQIVTMDGFCKNCGDGYESS